MTEARTTGETMAPRSTALIGWANACEPDLLGCFGKLATILFDELVFQVPTEDILRGALEGCAEHGVIEGRVVTELLRFWTPIQSCVPTYKFLEDGLNPKDNTTADLVWEGVLRRYRPEFPEDTDGAALAHETAWVTAGIIDTFSAWSALYSQKPCSLLATDLEKEVMSQVFAQADKPTDVECFSDIMQHLAPDLTATEWQRVLELRNSRFLEQFRRKMVELQRCVQIDDSRKTSEILIEMERRDLEEIARLSRPAPPTTILKAVLSNLPLPIPINPASVGLGIKEAMDAYNRAERFGWLYFLLDLRAGKGRADQCSDAERKRRRA